MRVADAPGGAWIVAAFLLGVFASCDGEPEQPSTEELCGACGSLATGQHAPAGDIRIDGLFEAADTLSERRTALSASIDASTTAIGVAYGLPVGDVSAQFIDDLVATVQVDLETHLDGELTIEFLAGECAASLPVSGRAQAECEAQEGCDADPTPSLAGVTCEGRCEGGCEGTCSGEQSCAWPFPIVDCDGACEGTCELSEPAACDGICRGACDDSCSSVTQGGECQGLCSGLCTGSCELRVGGACTGTCNGICRVDQGSAQCEDGAVCSGTCEGICTGRCLGQFETPATVPDCDASEICAAQSRARGQAALECSAPRLRFSFVLQGSLDSDVAAAFIERMAQLELGGAALLDDQASLQALMTGVVDGEQVFDPAPIVEIADRFAPLTDALFEEDFELPGARKECLGPALDEASAHLEATADKGNKKLAAVAGLISFLTDE
jgi:modification target Cys-rich repeat protein